MALKFVGGPKHGEEVPDWAHGRTEINVDAGAVQSTVDGCWDHVPIRYAKHTLRHPQGHQMTFLAPLDTTPLHEIENDANALFQIPALP